jgi:hypothetical protein
MCCSVAADESRHLSWCLQRLDELGYHYGCMVSHDLLWEGCQLSQHDLGARLAIVPMSQEARGLDAGDRLFKRLVGMGDNRTAAIVKQVRFTPPCASGAASTHPPSLKSAAALPPLQNTPTLLQIATEERAHVAVGGCRRPRPLLLALLRTVEAHVDM